MNTTTNMPILWQNAMLLAQTEIGRKAWIWFMETRGSAAEADKYAWAVDKLVLALRPMIDHANNPKDDRCCPHGASDEALDDLMRFILVRRANWRFGGNVRPYFLEDL